MSERNIGKVISVDSFRAYIRLDDDLKSLYKSGYEDIFEVARINSYIIIPIGADKIVAMVTSVRAIDETEIGKNKEAIFLTKSARYLVATMIGTIENSGKYIQGVYNYPILDNPVWYVTSQDLDNIFDQKQKKATTEINFEDDYYLPIGISPSFSDYKIKINPDKFFGKHAAILGNTGSGKSCTFASIIQSMFDFDYNGKKLKNAHVIIFDTNGEYKQAFQGTKEAPYKNLELVNPFHVDKDGMKVPFWFMNFADFDYLFEPTSGTQTPVFKHALGLAKNQTQALSQKLIPQAFISRLTTILQECDDNDFKIKNTIYDGLEEFGVEFKALDTDFDKANLLNALRELIKEKSKLSKPDKYVNGNVSSSVLTECSIVIRRELSLYYSSTNKIEIAKERNIDLPIYFNFHDLLQRFFDEAINEQENSGNRLREFVSTLRLRLQSYLGDERISQPLLLNQTEEILNSLAKFIAFILGDFCKVYKTVDTDLFTDFYKKQLGKKEIEKLVKDKPSQVTIIDMSLLPYEVLETITGLIGRLILDFVSRFPERDRGKLPMVIALEEAQNYIPERNRGDRESIAKKVFERIAREGRKYGISLLVTSQRPSELSKTVLSQCNSFLIHRLQNPEDQKYVRQLVSAANEDILQQLPILPQQHVVIMGDAVRTPVQARMNNANPRPNSNNPKFMENWTMDLPKDFPNYLKIAEAWEKGEKYKPFDGEPDIKEEKE
ncbi:ATP-binding protein [Cyclobacterium plantarum]|uniref:ATP-binding protein n=1 Tax=Cyclobacterium plantarum TaxID=2716263 RepID=UPI003F70AFEF